MEKCTLLGYRQNLVPICLSICEYAIHVFMCVCVFLSTKNSRFVMSVREYPSTDDSLLSFDAFTLIEIEGPSQEDGMLTSVLQNAHKKVQQCCEPKLSKGP